jgi:AraC-like DNA-binding protein
MNAAAITIQVLLCYKIFGTETWSNKNRSAPFWRLYWNANQGARLILNRNVVELTPDKIVLIPPNTPFDKEAECDVHHFFIHFSLSYASGQIEPGLYELPLSPEINTGIHETISLFNAGLTETPRFSLLTNLIVAQALIGLSEKMRIPTVTDPRLVMVSSFIDAHVGDRVTNTDLANLVGMNTNAFIHFFRMNMKTTPKKFCEAKRFQKACNLLKYSNLSINHIAEQTGFCDRNHFTKVFIKREKIGPSEYRKKSVIGG